MAGARVRDRRCGRADRRRSTRSRVLRAVVSGAVGPRSTGADAPGELQALDRWLLERTEQLVAEMTDAYEGYWTPALIRAFDSFVDDLSNWYIRRSRRRFWNGDEVALWSLWHALVRAVQVVAPVMPFLADFLWRRLRTEDATDSVFLAPWPELHE